MEYINADFSPIRAIVMSELGNRDKGVYYNLLATNDATFTRDSQGRIIANVRLLAANVVTNRQKKIANSEQKSATNTLPFEERLKRLANAGKLEIKLEGINPFDYNAFPKFSALISEPGTVVKPRMRALSWLMRLVEDAYDARFAHEKMDVERDDEAEAEQLESEQHFSSFPIFLVRQLSTLVGLKSLVEQTCWDLLFNAQRYRSDYLEVEVFMRFLQEFYDQDDLLFFLYVRAVVARTLHISFKRRWAKSEGAGRPPKALWMSYREATLVSKAVFGSTDEQMHRSFLNILNTQVVGQRTETTDSRRIEISQFLHLAVVAYHQTQLNDANAANRGRGNGGEIDAIGKESYNLPDDEELARALETDMESYTPHDSSINDYMKSMSSNQSASPTDRKKMVPTTASATKSTRNSAWTDGEAWGEAGYYHDNEVLAGENDNPDGVNVESSDSKGPVVDLTDPAFDQPRTERLDEFMEVLMDSLGSLPEDIVVGVQEQLYQALDEKLNNAIRASPSYASVSNVDDFDDLLVEILSADEFVNDMVAVRDYILESYGDEGVEES